MGLGLFVATLSWLQYAVCLPFCFCCAMPSSFWGYCYPILKEPVGQEGWMEASGSVCVSIVKWPNLALKLPNIPNWTVSRLKTYVKWRPICWGLLPRVCVTYTKLNPHECPLSNKKDFGMHHHKRGNGSAIKILWTRGHTEKSKSGAQGRLGILRLPSASASASAWIPDWDRCRNWLFPRKLHLFSEAFTGTTF